MYGEVIEIHCNKCGRYLFTEANTENGYKRINDNENYRYYDVKDEFICVDCDNEGNGTRT